MFFFFPVHTVISVVDIRQVYCFFCMSVKIFIWSINDVKIVLITRSFRCINNVHPCTKNWDSVCWLLFKGIHPNLLWIFVQPLLLNKFSDFYYYFCCKSLVFMAMLFLLSEHILCKENIVIVKNSTSRFCRNYTFWGLRNSFLLFSRWCMFVWTR